MPLLAFLLATGCQKEISKEILPEEFASSVNRSNTKKIIICHYDPKKANWSTIEIKLTDWPNYQAHGDDIRLDDEDGDGYVPNNECGYGQMGDCNDNDANVNPGVTETCGDGVDNNCDGNIDEDCIPSVAICDQTWMLKNLDVDHYRNGDPIPQVQDQTAWWSLTTGAWCYYQNNSSNGTVYGKLYNWYAVNDPRGLAPQGWHIPTDVEWNTLLNCLGSWEVAGGKMKSTGTIQDGTGLWYAPNTYASNSSGFTGLPGGCTFNNTFVNVGYTGYWWSSTESNSTNALQCTLGYTTGSAWILFYQKQFGFSVRCVRD